MSENETNSELEELSGQLIHEMADALDRAIDQKAMEMDEDDSDEDDEFETGLDDDEFEQFKEDLAEAISMESIMSSEEFGTVALIKSALSFYEKADRTDEWNYEVLAMALEKAIQWEEEFGND